MPDRELRSLTACKGGCLSAMQVCIPAGRWRRSYCTGVRALSSGALRCGAPHHASALPGGHVENVRVQVYEHDVRKQKTEGLDQAGRKSSQKASHRPGKQR